MAGHGSKQHAGLALTKRDRFWQEHLGRIASSGGSAKRYAEQHGLSIGALYEAKRHLAARRAPTLHVTQPKPAPLFTRVTLPVSPTPRESAALRLRLTSGAVLEWATPPPIEALAALLGRIGSPR